MANNDQIINSLTAQSGELREKIERDKLAIERAIQELLTDVEDHNHFEKTAEALTRRSEHPYQARLISDPLAGVARFFIQEQQPASNGNQLSFLPLPLLPPKITKSGIVLKVVKANPGLKSKGIFEKVEALDEKEKPMEIIIDDVYRALPRLIHKREIWRDEHGRYYAAGYRPESEDKK